MSRAGCAVVISLNLTLFFSNHTAFLSNLNVLFVLSYVYRGCDVFTIESSAQEK